MRLRVAAPSLLLLLLATASAGRADFKAGLQAYAEGDFAAAEREWHPLAESGMVEAQYNLGLLHQQGKGVARDAAVAHAWYLRAAEAGYARAQYRVAEMYEAGEGVRSDLIQAHLWFTMAGRDKFSDARKRRRRVADRMTPEQIARAEMLARHRDREAKSRD